MSWQEDDATIARLKQELEEAEVNAIEDCTSHWFLQGGKSQFGDIGNPRNPDELIAAILRVVRLQLPPWLAAKDQQ
jgi:hypothetical protein